MSYIIAKLILDQLEETRDDMENWLKKRGDMAEFKAAWYEINLISKARFLTSMIKHYRSEVGKVMIAEECGESDYDAAYLVDKDGYLHGKQRGDFIFFHGELCLDHAPDVIDEECNPKYKCDELIVDDEDIGYSYADQEGGSDCFYSLVTDEVIK